MTKTNTRQLGDSIPQMLNAYDPKVFPAFHETLNTYFPGSIPMNKYMRKTFQSLSAYDFSDENTMAMIAVCRDEIAEALFIEVIRYWGKTFNCCSLAGFVTMGKTGLAAATDHTPIVDGLRRFTFYAMPHIAISRYGEIGKVYRTGVNAVSHACGALETVVHELAEGHLNLEMDMQDIEQTIIRQKIISTLTYGDKPNLIEVTKLASHIISSDVENLLNTLDRKIFKYAVMTGIQIHGPLGSHWIYPQDFYVVGSELPGGRENIGVFQEQKSKVVSSS